MMVIGIDTGISGGMALYSEGVILECYDVPFYWETMKSKTKNGNFKKRKRLDYYNAATILARWHGLGARDIVIEKIHSMPHDGGSAAFSFGEAFGAFQAFAAGVGFSTEYVTPETWQKDLGLIGGNKYDALELAREMFGTEYFKRKKDHNRADAALIAAYGFKLLNSKSHDDS